jgi:hypothetical protein
MADLLTFLNAQFPVSEMYSQFMLAQLNITPMKVNSERTIPTERPPLVGEVIVNFCG